MSASPDDLETIPFAHLAPSEQRDRLKDLAVVFSKLGAIAFGGPAAHIAMIDDEVVQKRRWMSHSRLMDLLGVTNLIPGPNSTELAIHIGYEYGGWRGLLVAGTCFILPAMLIVWLLAFLYMRYQALPQVEWLLYGIKPVVIAIVVQALWKLGKKAIKDGPTTLAAIAVIVAFFMGVHELLLLLVAGLGVMVVKNLACGRSLSALLLPTSGILAQASTATPMAATTPGVFNIFLFFLKIGAVLYGSGYVLLAFLQRDVVERSQWLTSQQLLDAVAIGQVTPGPVFTTATFVGYLLGGNLGAIAATVGIFLPAFVLIWVVNPWVSKLRSSVWASGFLDGVNAATLGLMVIVTYTLTKTALIDPFTIVVALLSAIAVFRFKVNSAWLVIAGGLVGLGAKLLGWV
ncbi:MAG: chromate transporter [Synechococcales cyanobacterium T60_A2020_003]|nr:chromate transporter [Synechococcales cyanobacterium T60_A2020_003]